MDPRFWLGPRSFKGTAQPAANVVSGTAALIEEKMNESDRSDIYNAEEEFENLTSALSQEDYEHLEDLYIVRHDIRAAVAFLASRASIKTKKAKNILNRMYRE